MDQIKIGSFLKSLRKEKNLTQEALAEKLSVSNRTVSRWETGSNMPDIGTLVEIAEFYDVSIPEIINGERESEIMNKETKETAIKMAEYSRSETKKTKKRVAGWLLVAFGVFIIVSALIMFPTESSWSSIYSVFGSVISIVGVCLIVKTIVMKRGLRLLIAALCAVLFFALFSASDYLSVTQSNQVPRFRYETVYSSEAPDRLIYKTLFFTAVCENPGTKDEKVYIVKDNNP